MVKGILGLILVVAVMGGAYVMLGSSGMDASPKESGDAAAEAEAMEKLEKAAATKPAGNTQTLNDIMARGGDWICTFTSEDPRAKTEGTMYVSGNQARGDFKSTIASVNMTAESHMIQKDGFVYTWSNMIPQGIKSKAVTDVNPTAAMPSGQGAFDAGVAFAYDCNPWSKDVSKFNPPAGVSFMEVN
jgi:hypothetical protein